VAKKANSDKDATAEWVKAIQYYRQAEEKFQNRDYNTFTFCASNPMEVLFLSLASRNHVGLIGPHHYDHAPAIELSHFLF